MSSRGLAGVLRLAARHCGGDAAPAALGDVRSVGGLCSRGASDLCSTSYSPSRSIHGTAFESERQVDEVSPPGRCAALHPSMRGGAEPAPTQAGLATHT